MATVAKVKMSPGQLRGLRALAKADPAGLVPSNATERRLIHYAVADWLVDRGYARRKGGEVVVSAKGRKASATA